MPYLNRLNQSLFDIKAHLAFNAYHFCETSGLIEGTVCEMDGFVQSCERVDYSVIP